MIYQLLLKYLFFCSIHFVLELSNIYRFWIHLDSIKIYCNDNQSRTFISLSLAKHNPNANTNLQSIVKQLDNSLMDFKLPAFYKVSLNFGILISRYFAAKKKIIQDQKFTYLNRMKTWLIFPGSIVSCEPVVVFGR